MRNTYAGPCFVCKDRIDPGMGVLHRSKGQWRITHIGHCPQNPVREGHAKNLIHRCLSVLDEPQASVSQIESAVACLGQVIATGWIDARKCEERILSSPSLRQMDRLDAENVLTQNLSLLAGRVA